MVKKITVFLIIILLSVVNFVAFASEEQYQKVKITVIKDGDCLLQKEYYKNPDFFGATCEYESEAHRLSSIFGEEEFCNYSLSGFGDDIKALFDDVDDIKVFDCVEFDARTQSFSYFPERSCLVVDRKNFFDKLFSNFEKNEIVIDLEFCKREPLYTKEYLMQNTSLVASFSTSYASSNQNRKKNIALASKKLSGIVIDAKQTFSFNEIVGKRTKENGFEESIVIQDGQYVSGVGGGVCQVATTVYNALLRAGLTPISQARHSLAPSYVPLSFDAMVSEVVDLKMRNDTGKAIYLSVVADGKQIKAKAYGKKGNIRYEFESETLCEIIHEDVNETNADMYRKGYKSKGYKLIYENDVLVKKVLLRSDIYKPYKVSAE